MYISYIFVQFFIARRVVMKKFILPLLLLLSLCVFICSCADDTPGTDDSKTGSTSADITEKEPVKTESETDKKPVSTDEESSDKPASSDEASSEEPDDKYFGQILVGTPTIDGKLDPAYKNSLALEIGVGNNAYGTEWLGSTYGTVYFLYNEDYLYVCADITDPDLTDKGADYCNSSNPYQNDCFELRLASCKISCDAYGHRVFGLPDHEARYDYSKIKHKTSITDKGYIVELAIPAPFVDLNQPDIGLRLQLNNIDSNGVLTSFSTDYSAKKIIDPKVVLLYELINEDA